MNVPLSTPSSEASKMFDASLTQLYNYHNDPGLGGIRGTLKAMQQADPLFVVGQAMIVGLQLMSGDSPRCNPALKSALENVISEAEKQTNISPSEKKHVKAVQLLGDGYMAEACKVWEHILIDHPLDPLALKMAWTGYIYLGDSCQLRDSVARVLPHWKTTTPLYGFLLGMHAFGLEETNLIDRAEKLAAKALEINRHDAWSTHTMTHVYEMTGQQDKGIAFLDSTLPDWEVCGLLACHIWWHLALHYVEKGDYEKALYIFDNQVKSRCVQHKDLFNIADSAALLFRLEMEGVKVDKRWQPIVEVSEHRLEEHMTAFNDLHLMMTCLGSGSVGASKRMMDSLEQFVSESHGTARDVHRNVGVSLCKAMAAYKDCDFALATEIVYPLRYKIVSVGGSNSQRDIFNLFLLSSAIKSSKSEHHRLARALLAERKALKESSPLTDRLIARVMALHGD